MDNNRSTTLLKNIHEEIVKGSLNDIDIVCDDGQTTGSRLVLAALSPYFRAMLTSDMTESRTGVLHLPSVSLSVFENILKMQLCGVDLVNEDNCIQILDAAEMMQLDDVKDLCHRYLQQWLELTPENCLHWWGLMNRYGFSDLTGRVFAYLTDNLAAFIDTENLIQLSKAELLEVLSKDDLKCKEDTVVRAVMTWIEANNPDDDDVTAMFEALHLDIVDPQVLIDEVVFSSIVSKNSSVRGMIQRILHTYQPRISPTRSNSRFISKRADVYVLHRHENSLLSLFSPDGTWVNLPSAPVNHGYWYSAVILGEKIYITGCQTKSKCTLVYDICRKAWQTGPELVYGRCFHCMTALDERLYVIGGQGTNTIEEMGESATQWHVVGDLNQNREHAFAVTVNGVIMVMGGRTESVGSNLVQCFNTTTRIVYSLMSRLPCCSRMLRGSVHLPDVYLLDYDGNVMHVEITETDGKIRIDTKSTVKWESFGYCYGVVYRNGSLLCFNNDGVRKFNIGDGKEEKGIFPKSPRHDHVYDVLSLESSIIARTN
ncbi:kelch-like protein 2 [Gigantopelta aegis]|uniref:kelch-like protein 2 n=1 Tax=Gigantopelta aegis TaxID=1735272 RepID=UPI001B88B5E2|nr:kelch-like protein 2 [Gigantopelta aegis]